MYHFFKKLVYTCCLSLLAIWAGVSAAGAIAPDMLVHQVTDDVLDIIRNDQRIQSGDTQKLDALIEVKVLPHFDFTRMTSLALGKNWKKANQEQQRRLTKEFKTLLVRTYSNALVGYRDQKIVYRPFKMPLNAKDVTVRTQVDQPGARPIDLDYWLELQNDTWKVYDVVVGGVSLVTNYRDTFNQKVRAEGIGGLIQWLVDKNKANFAAK